MIKTLHKFYKMLNKSEKAQFWGVFILVFFVGIVEILGIASIIPIIAIMSSPALLETNEHLILFRSLANTIGLNTSSEVLVLLGSISLFIIFTSSLLRSIGVFSATRFIELRRHSLSFKLFSGYLKNDYLFFVNNNSANLTKLILSETDRLVAQIIRPIVQMVSYIFVLLFIIAFLIIIQPVLTIITLSILAFFYALMYISLRARLKRLGNQTVNANKSRFHIVNEAFANIKYLKLRKLENYYASRFEKSSYNFSDAVSQQFISNQIPKYIVEFFAFGGMVLISIFALLNDLSTGRNEVQTLFPLLGAYALSAYRLQPALQAIFNGIVSLRYGEIALQNLLDAFQEISAKPDNNFDLTRNKLSFQKEINIDNLSFKFQSRDRHILQNASITIPKRSFTGIVGPTGSGKSTFINILLGLLKPTDGEIRIDDMILSEQSIEQWQAMIGYVPQEISLIDASIFENIAFGDNPEDIDFTFARYCGEIAQIESALLNDEDTNHLDKIGEGGIKLSGGQKQRIGIARALYKKPDLLLLDEATSALDPKTEEEVMKSIYKLSEAMTIIMITHKHRTLNKCDFVYEIKEGKLTKKR